MSFSQIGQDLEVLRFYGNKTGGFFVEVGASDGVSLSNTYLLETRHKWKGICVEPVPNKFKLLCENRPNSICCSKAAFNVGGIDVSFDIANNFDLLSGISDKIDCHRDAIDANKTRITVKTITLGDLLRESGAPSFIDYLSLDTEGSELEVLKSVDFDKYTFGLIDVEHNYIEPKRARIRELLTSSGYIYLRANKWDDCYRHNSVNPAH